MKVRCLIARTAITFMLVGAAGCSSTKTPPNSENSKQEPAISYTHVWSADQGIDLFSRGAELIRGTFEAGYLTQFVGVGKSYPGYTEAVGEPASWRDENKSERWVWSEPDPYVKMIKPGTYYSHIVNYSASDTQITADVCSYGLSVAHSSHPDSPWVLDDSAQVQLTNIGNTPGLPGIPDDDPAGHATSGHRSPNWNIFDSWHVTRIKKYADGAIPAACADWWIQQFPTFSRSPDGNFVTSPPDFQIPIHPVAVQYPEWIGPSEQR